MVLAGADAYPAGVKPSNSKVVYGAGPSTPGDSNFIALSMSLSGCCTCTLVPVAKEWMKFPEKVLVDAIYGMWLALLVFLPFSSSSLQSPIHSKWNRVEVESPPGSHSSHPQFEVKTVLVEHQERGHL